MSACTFCGKSQSMVKKLVAGPGVYICDQCILLCQTVVDEEFPSDKPVECKCKNEEGILSVTTTTHDGFYGANGTPMKVKIVVTTYMT